MMSQRNMEGFTQAALLAVVLMLLVIASSMGYEDEQREQGVYCQMVKEGSWPDYKNIAGEVCK